MKFYSDIVDQPHAVVKQIKEYNKVLKQKLLCVFTNGELETDDEEVIAELLKHPNRFRTTKEKPPLTKTEQEIELDKIRERAKGAGIKIAKRKKSEILQELNERK